MSRVFRCSIRTYSTGIYLQTYVHLDDELFLSKINSFFKGCEMSCHIECLKKMNNSCRPSSTKDRYRITLSNQNLVRVCYFVFFKGETADFLDFKSPKNPKKSQKKKSQNPKKLQKIPKS